MPKIGGFRRAELDERDWPFHSIQLLEAGEMGDDVLLPERTPISDQSQASSCVANATCDAFELVMDDPVQLSRLFVYWNARNQTGDAGRDEGAYIRNAFSSLAKLGAPVEEVWPYDLHVINERPSLASYEAGYDHRIDSFYAIPELGQARLDEMERAIRHGLPVVFGTDIGREFENTHGTTPLDYPVESRGGHALCVTGFFQSPKGLVWVIRNSWGTGYGNGGYCLFSSAYMSHAATCDLWVPLPMHYLR